MLLDLIPDNEWPKDNPELQGLPDPDEGAKTIIAPIEKKEEGLDDDDLEEETALIT